MPQRAYRFTLAVGAGAAAGIAAGLLGVVAGGQLWALIFLGPFLSGALAARSELAYDPGRTGMAFVHGAAAGVAAGFLCMAALPAYLAVWQEVSLLMVYNPLYWTSHQAEVSDQIGSRSGWCIILGSLFVAGSLIEGVVASLVVNLMPRQLPDAPARPAQRRATVRKAGYKTGAAQGR